MDRTSGTRAWLPLAALLALALWAYALLVFSSASVADSSEAKDEAVSVPNELVVGFESDASRPQQREAVAQAGAAIESRIDLIDGAVITVDSARSIRQVARELARDDSVTFVEPNYVVRAARVPNDGAFGELWGLRNTGDLGGKVGADIHAPAAWDLVTGGPITVAVVDTGIDYAHPDLAGNMWANPAEPANGRDDDGNGFVDDTRGADFLDNDSDPSDDSGHGTHIAGIIGAQGNNGIGTVGVDWDVRLMAARFLDASGEGNTADAASAIDYAVANGANVVNASWGGPAFSQTLYEAVRQARDQGVLFVTAAGNDGVDADSTPDYPAAFDLSNVISVTASDRNDELASFSNFGKASVDLAAPGDEIYSTVPTHTDPSGYAVYSGTSMASPFVSGAAALYLARFPRSSVDQVRGALLQTTDHIPSLANKTVTGGRLNVARALGILGSRRPAPRDVTAPRAFMLLRPRNHKVSRSRSLRFHWQRSRDNSGIRFYELYVDSRRRKTLRDPDGPGGRDPSSKARLRLGSGRHRWFVRAYDYAGNRRTSKVRRQARSSSVLYVGRRR